MPLRPLSAEPKFGKACLRGEDIAFLGEAKIQRMATRDSTSLSEVPGWLQGAKVLNMTFSNTSPKYAFTKKLDHYQFNNFIPSLYTMGSDISALHYKNSAQPDIAESATRSAAYISTDWQVTTDDLNLWDDSFRYISAYNNWPKKLELSSVEAAFEDLKVLSCPYRIVLPSLYGEIQPANIANIAYDRVGDGFNWSELSTTIDWSAPFKYKGVGSYDKLSSEGCGMSFLSGLYYAYDGRFGYVNLQADKQYLEDVEDEKAGGVDLWLKCSIYFNANYTDTDLSTYFCNSIVNDVLLHFATGYNVLGQLYLDYTGTQNTTQWGRKMLETIYEIGWRAAGAHNWAKRISSNTILGENERFYQEVRVGFCTWIITGKMGEHTKWWQ